MEETANVKDAADIVPSISLQPIPVNMISHFAQNGGNALGISTADGPLMRGSFQALILKLCLLYKQCLTLSTRGPTLQTTRV